MPLYLGLMSGTSLDGVDAVVVDLPDEGPGLRVCGHGHQPFGPDLADALLALNRRGDDELHRSALANHALAEVCLAASRHALKAAGVDIASVRAAGVHGQTVRHQPLPANSNGPRPAGGFGYTVQLDPSAWLAEWLGCVTVSDFRSQDVAAGGQGAPLVPAFHAAVFGRAGEPVAVLNLGGMANLTLLDGQGGVTGFDTGPANVLLDACMQDAGVGRFDADGARARTGRIDPGVLAALRSDPYFAASPPKSTGRDLFSPGWIGDRLVAAGGGPSVQWASMELADRLATLAELTASTVADALHTAAATGGSGAWTRAPVWVCGGGARNRHLMDRLAHWHPGAPVRPSDDAGLPADQVEACAFAWLARERLAGRPTTVAAVTGAVGPRCTGAVRLPPTGRPPTAG